MTIIDRYVFWKFFRTFILCYISLVGVYVVFDLFTNLGDFISTGAGFRLLFIVPEYYFINSFVFIDMIFPLLLLTSAVAATATMARQNELIALLANGVSPLRTMLPIFIGAFGVSLAFTAVREEFLPKRLVEITMSPKDFVQKSDEIPVFRSFDNWSQLSIDGEKIVRSEEKLVAPKILLGRNLNKYGNRIVAKTGIYWAAEGDRPGGWLLQGVSTPADFASSPSLRDENLSENPIVYSPKDASWLGADEAFVATSLDPKRLAVGDVWRFYDSTKTLLDALDDPTFGRESLELTIRVYSRIFRPLADLLPLFLGIPFVFLRNDRNIFAAIGAGALLAGAYVASQFASAYVGEKTGVVAIGIWAPYFIFVPIAANLFGEMTKKDV